MDLKERFTADLLVKLEHAAAIGCGVSARTMQTVNTKGGAELARFIISRQGASENFDKLARAGRLELSLEAQVVEPKFAALFADDEVNYCFGLLCEAGFYVI